MRGFAQGLPNRDKYISIVMNSRYNPCNLTVCDQDVLAVDFGRLLARTPHPTPGSVIRLCEK